MSSDLHRTNINLYAEDVAWLERTFGHGWTITVRNIVSEWVNNHRHNTVLQEESVRNYVRDKITRENPGSDFP